MADYALRLYVAPTNSQWNRAMNFKAKLRAWLIDLVREAIRIEHTAEYSIPKTTPKMRAPFNLPPPLIKPTNVELTPIVFEPSFEQMQADAIKEQEKFYEPTRL
jgi:hypothetical protein